MITRLFELKIDFKDKELFNSTGTYNLMTSIEKEEGTMAMYSTHIPEQPDTYIVFEIYKDDDAYEVHASSEQFGKYRDMAAKVLTGRKVFATTPELLIESGSLKIDGANNLNVRLASVGVLKEKDEDFREAVFTNMKTSIEKEEGVLMMYAMTLQEDPTQWRFFEVYASEEAYQTHRDTDHFKTYISKTADCIYEKTLQVLSGDTLVSHGYLK